MTKDEETKALEVISDKAMSTVREVRHMVFTTGQKQDSVELESFKAKNGEDREYKWKAKIYFNLEEESGYGYRAVIEKLNDLDSTMRRRFGTTTERTRKPAGWPEKKDAG
jgi:hypothetical protein